MKVFVVWAIVTIVLKAAAGGEQDTVNLSNADLQVAKATLESYVKELQMVLGQIRGAFTSTQFDDVHRRILSEPHSIISDASSPLQVSAANLVLKIRETELLVRTTEIGLERKNAEGLRKTQNETFYRALRESMNEIFANFSNKVDFTRPSIETVARSALLRWKVKNFYHEYLNATNFFSRSKEDWISFVSQKRNALTNKVSRFRIAHQKVDQYRFALSALLSTDKSNGTELEIFLRSRALDKFSKALNDMELGESNFTSHFISSVNCDGVALTEQERLDRACQAQYGTFSRFDVHSSCYCVPQCSTTSGGKCHSNGKCPGFEECSRACLDGQVDILFSLQIQGKTETFGVLRTLNRRTRHFLHSQSQASSAALEAFASLIARQPSFLHHGRFQQQTVLPPEYTDEANRPTFADFPTIPFPGLISVFPETHYPDNLPAAAGATPAASARAGPDASGSACPFGQAQSQAQAAGAPLVLATLVSELAEGCEDRLGTWGIESLGKEDSKALQRCRACRGLEPSTSFSRLERASGRDGMLLAQESKNLGGVQYVERAGGSHHLSGRTTFGGGWRVGGRGGAAGPSRLMPCGWYFRPGADPWALEPVATRCPVDIWDEPPNELWNWEAAEAAAAAVWAQHEGLASREGAAEEALLRAVREEGA